MTDETIHEAPDAYTVVTQDDAASSVFIFPYGVAEFAKQHNIDLISLDGGYLYGWVKGTKGWTSFPPPEDEPEKPSTVRVIRQTDRSN